MVSYDQRTRELDFFTAVGRKKENKGNNDPGNEDLPFSLLQALLFIFRESLTPAFSKRGYWFLVPNVGQLISVLGFDTYLWQLGLNILSLTHSAACNVKKVLDRPSKT